jgi:hypothetical protein
LILVIHILSLLFCERATSIFHLSVWEKALHWNNLLISVIEDFKILPFKSINKNKVNWLIIYGFTSRWRIFHFIWRRHQCRWRAAKFRPLLGAQGLWAGRDFYCATPAVTRGLGFSGLIRRAVQFSRLLRYRGDAEDLF